jgi:deoxyribonuclease-4
MSIAGGPHLAFARLATVKGKALQIFTANHRRWRQSQLTQVAIDLFRHAWEESGGMPIASHDSYLINLAANDETILSRSISAFAEELRRCEALSIPYIIMHPGAHVGEGVEQGLVRFVRNLDRAIELADPRSTLVLIETTAGQGSTLGSSFEEISFMLQTSKFGEAMGVCYDTCHTFTAGYDIRDEQAYTHTMSKFEASIGLERLKFFHLNDSKREFGSRVDRHEHIGKGKIGLEGFRLLLNDARFQDHPMVLETPKGKDLKEDRENLAVLRSLLAPSPLVVQELKS